MIGETIKLKDGRKLGFAHFGEPAGSPSVYCAGGIGTRLQIQPTPQYPIPSGIRWAAIIGRKFFGPLPCEKICICNGAAGRIENG
jgi:hypothetical protein